jgi:hypothetical protein
MKSTSIACKRCRFRKLFSIKILISGACVAVALVLFCFVGAFVVAFDVCIGLIAAADEDIVVVGLDVVVVSVVDDGLVVVIGLDVVVVGVVFGFVVVVVVAAFAIDTHVVIGVSILVVGIIPDGAVVVAFDVCIGLIAVADGDVVVVGLDVVVVVVIVVVGVVVVAAFVVDTVDDRPDVVLVGFVFGFGFVVVVIVAAFAVDTVVV